MINAHFLFQEQQFYLKKEFQCISEWPLMCLSSVSKTLDKCFIRIKNSYNSCHQLAQLGNSDHFVMHLIPSYEPRSKSKPTIITRRIYKDNHCEDLRACFETTLWDNMLTSDDDINTQTDIITGYINFCTDLCIPTKKVKKYANQKPWVTKQVIDMIDAKHKAHLAGNKKLYHKLKRQISKENKKSREHYSKKIQQHLANDPANAWNDIKKISGLPTNATQPATHINIKPDELNKFFSRYEKPNTTTPETVSSNSTAPHLEITEDQVRKQLLHLNSRKGAGPDGLIPRVLKLCAYQLTPIITNLFNNSLESQTTPDIWKSAIIKPLPKIAKPDQPKHFRPIALTSCLCKTMERLLKQYITSHTPLGKHQFAYRAGRSTQDAVLCLTTTVTNFIDKHSSNYARCLYLDFSSAFNTINVTNLISQLRHLDSRVTNWVGSFLSGRTQRTIVDNKLSQPITTYTGTPQGSVLSPLLFSVYTNRITSTLNNVTVIKYADDTCIIGCIANESDLSDYFYEISRITEQCKDLDLLLNPSKTKEMLFSTRRDKPVSPALKIDDVEIEFCDNVKYLGILVDNKLRFEEHVQNTVTKASQRMHIVRTFLYKSTKSLSAMLFKSFIISILTYCIPILYPCVYAKEKRPMRKFFKEADRHELPGISDLDTIIDKRTKTLIMSYIHDEEHFINDFLEQLPSGRYRTLKYRSAWGKDCFLRLMIHSLNDIFK